MNLAGYAETFNIVGGNVLVWSADVSPGDENEKIPSGETPALHTYSYEVPQYFR